MKQLKSWIWSNDTSGEMLSLTPTKVNPYSEADMKIFESLLQTEEERDAMNKFLDTFINFVIGDPQKK